MTAVAVKGAERHVSSPQRNEVDAVSLDATHSYIAGKCGLVPVVTEYYGIVVK